MKKEELIAKMAEKGYIQISSNKDYVMYFIHNNGMSTATYQKTKSLSGKEIWEPCF